jgi:hypothetical protein
MPRTPKLTDAILFDGIQQPWRRDLHCRAYPNPIVSMMSHDEMVFLRWIAEHQTQPGDAIIDMGPLAGGSTLAMARGARASNASEKIIHSYDLWRYYEGHAAYFPGNNLHEGDDVFPLFWGHVAEVHQYVCPHKGDICTMTWAGEPIGILFLDAAKHPLVMAHVVNQFLPFLRPGGIFVQQDFVSCASPWIHIAQELVSERFDVVDSPFGGSVCFLCKDQNSRDHLPPDFFSSLSPECGRNLIQRAALRVHSEERLCVDLSEAYYCLMLGNFNEAGAILERVCDDPNFGDVVKPDATIIAGHLTRGERPRLDCLDA